MICENLQFTWIEWTSKSRMAFKLFRNSSSSENRGNYNTDVILKKSNTNRILLILPILSRMISFNISINKLNLLESLSRAKFSFSISISNGLLHLQGISKRFVRRIFSGLVLFGLFCSTWNHGFLRSKSSRLRHLSLQTSGSTLLDSEGTSEIVFFKPGLTFTGFFLGRVFTFVFLSGCESDTRVLPLDCLRTLSTRHSRRTLEFVSGCLFVFGFVDILLMTVMNRCTKCYRKRANGSHSYEYSWCEGTRLSALSKSWYVRIIIV